MSQHASACQCNSGGVQVSRYRSHTSSAPYKYVYGRSRTALLVSRPGLSERKRGEVDVDQLPLGEQRQVGMLRVQCGRVAGAEILVRHPLVPQPCLDGVGVRFGGERMRMVSAHKRPEPGKCLVPAL